ncbi:MAG: aminoacyl-tRNA hydrolase [Polyangiaceae bacterium]|nr:aminoacyl-tRNA hydrolase [Polyangiaceae bacterium]
MILVAGLGNPGPSYDATRHNIGFRVVDALARRLELSFREKFMGQFALGRHGGEQIGLIKPQTFMNRSGQSVGPVRTFYKVDIGAVLVVHDELDVPFGQMRLKAGGGEAGHNGLRSISSCLGGKDYLRLRLGVGRPNSDFRGSRADYVLQAFAPAEESALDDIVNRAADAVELVIDRGIDDAMNAINRRIETSD